MRLNVRPCLLCGELHGGHLNIMGFEICAGCETRLLRGERVSLRNLRRLAVKARICGT